MSQLSSENSELTETSGLNDFNEEEALESSIEDVDSSSFSNNRKRLQANRIRIVPATMQINRDLILQVKKSFTYIPDNSVVLNSMLMAGNFELGEVVEHIRKVFSRPSKATLDENNIIRLKLLPEVLKLCKEYRLELEEEFIFVPDIHTVTNALLCTGDFLPQKVVAAVCNTYKKATNLKVSYSEQAM